ncbi:MAG: hypothetical protein SFZ23_08990 [Planctomycetota bacterium]|nr:hypothetical protein [Planctomycetota bacterium]
MSHSGSSPMESRSLERLLYYIPIVHAEADLGSLAGAARERVGAADWSKRQDALARDWIGIERWATLVPIPPNGLLVFQDGLPVCGPEMRDAAGKPGELRIVEEMAARGSPNGRILMTLVDRGATLMGTESPELLLRELEAAKAKLASGRTTPPDETSSSLLRERDAFIARRINKSLKGGSAGVLLIGAMHDVAPLLDDDIRVEHPIDRRSFWSSTSHASRTRTKSRTGRV